MMTLLNDNKRNWRLVFGVEMNGVRIEFHALK